MSGAPFGARLDGAFAAHGHLCVGIDPHPYLLQEWGLGRDAEGARDFGLRVVDAAAGRVGIVKPQVAFFESFGSAGFAALEHVLAAARAAGLLVIGDAKRGDIGSTNDGYAAAWLAEGSPLEVDALTVTAYTGVGALAGLIDTADATGKGVFVLSATSNPEARGLQTATTDAGETVARLVADGVAARNTDRTRLGDHGLVLGATRKLDEYGFTNDAARALSTTPVLAPGFGFQGAAFESIPAVFGQLAPNVVVSVSRSVLALGSASDAGAAGLAEAIERESAALGEVLR
ncbi:orotidine-5'-phosphate decarboxylase [Herbiconiux sp. CPCC 205716]|uniref:Orotidine-5'-phosphate decarboxylase n=1 Tax=Herbiconiux gentiana TaxID=2970912 RepID=A0ABT2GBF5_9MICO|nr:orotidine-5'-phosphate decarboxylase [Herbiconiux gentiana]MCS5713012.1 orotidine-5'-phosphate decarboxylase [Herbiconiux gentiana]